MHCTGLPSAAPRKGGETNTCQVTKNDRQFKTTHLCIWVCRFTDMFRETVLILKTSQGKPGSLQNRRVLSQFACWLLGSPGFLAPWQPAWEPWAFAKRLGARRLLWIPPFWQLWKNSSLARLTWNHFPGCLGSSKGEAENRGGFKTCRFLSWVWTKWQDLNCLSLPPARSWLFRVWRIFPAFLCTGMPLKMEYFLCNQFFFCIFH